MSSIDQPKAIDLDAQLSSLETARPNSLYYAITLTADENGRVVFGTQTEWVGWKDEQRREELRQARLVYPEFVELWRHMQQPYAVIHTPDEMMLFLLGGGNALVEQGLARGVFARLLGEPEPSIFDGETGFVSPSLLPKTAFHRAPTPKIRMQVLQRDGRRCRICGRKPEDNSDLVLHVHHIRPWERGGITDPKNLITLCHTCHSGLSPHEDPSLYDYLRSDDTIRQKLLEFRAGVARYRKVGFLGEVGSDKRK